MTRPRVPVRVPDLENIGQESVAPGFFVARRHGIFRAAVSRNKHKWVESFKSSPTRYSYL